MRLALHILRKDLRRHWPAAAMFSALVLAFAIQQPREWRGAVFNNRLLDRFIDSIPFLLVLVWVFFLIRLVHEENFIGDRQFWITRPYQWHQLLAAKFLGALLFVHFPLLVMQLVLLKVAHFPVLSSFPGLLWIHFLLFVAIDLPCFTVAVITSGIGQAAIAIVAALLLTAAVLATLNHIADVEFVMDEIAPAIFLLLLGTCIAVVFLQYIFRRYRLNRLIVSASALLASILTLSAPFADLASPSYPVAASDRPSPATLVMDRTLAFTHQPGFESRYFDNEVQVEIPLSVSNLPEQTVFQFQAVDLNLQLPKGAHWSSQWQSFSQTVAYGRTRTWVTVKIKRPEFLRFANSPVQARISLAFKVFKLGTGVRIPLNGPTLRLPGGARCLDPDSDSLKCFAALRMPSPLFIMADLPSSSCHARQDTVQEPWAPAPAFDISLSDDSYPDMALSPIQDRHIALDRYTQFEDLSVRVPLCRGTTLFVNQPEFLYSNRVEIDLGQIILDDYRSTYPRQIGPPPKHLVPDDPSNSLSLNLLRFPLGLPNSLSKLQADWPARR